MQTASQSTEPLGLFPGQPRPRLYDRAIEVLRVHHYSLRTERDLARGFGTVELPYALERKFAGAASEFRWQYVFPATTIGTDPRSGVRRRHHLHESAVGRAISAAVRRTDITKRVTAHTFQHSFATHLIESGYDIRTMQELLGHKDVRTTMIYTHVLNKGGRGVQSPADFLPSPQDNAQSVIMRSVQDKQ